MLRCLRCGKHEKWHFNEWPNFECPDCGDRLIWIDRQPEDRKNLH